MSKEDFWAIIENSKSVLSETERDGNLENQVEVIRESLMKLDKNGIIEFEKLFHEFSQNLYTWELWGAAYVMAGGCSDDSFSDFRSWIISLGRDAYELALVSPDDLGPLSKEPTVEDFFFEELSYVASEVYEELFDDELDIDLPYLPDPKGKEWDEDEVDNLYPKLAKIYS